MPLTWNGLAFSVKIGDSVSDSNHKRRNPAAVEWPCNRSLYYQNPECWCDLDHPAMNAVSHGESQGTLYWPGSTIFIRDSLWLPSNHNVVIRMSLLRNTASSRASNRRVSRRASKVSFSLRWRPYSKLKHVSPRGLQTALTS